MRLPLASTALLASFLSLANAQAQITVNLGTTYQEIDGFGVSQAFTRANEFKAMRAEPRQLGLDYLFDVNKGAGFTVIRMRIGAASKPLNNESFCILPNNPGGPNAPNPAWVWDGDDASQVWLLKEAMKYGVNQFIADAWSAPAYMKTNNNVNGGGYLCGVQGRSCASGDWREMYARYLTQYVKFYRQEGINITYIGFLNEPDFAASYEAMLSNGHEAASFIPYLHRNLQSAGLGDVGINCCDAMGWDSQKTISSQLQQAGAEQYLKLITSHAYSSEPRNVMNTRLKVWQTEAADLNSRWSATWYGNGGPAEGLTWANKIHTGMVNANLSAYIYWQGVEVNQYQASSYLVASDNTKVEPSGRLWAFAQWSRYVRPGARRVQTTGSVNGVNVGAFRNADGAVAVIFTSNSGSAQSVRVTINGITPVSAEAFVTDNSRAVAAVTATLSGNAVTVSVPARSVLTIRVR